MKYNLIKTEDVQKSILELNNVNLCDLIQEYDFNINDEVILNFKKELDKSLKLKFLIVGDYDCDGISATTIIKRLFNHINIESNFYIPSRIKEGYGLNIDIVIKAKQNNFDALILVDNGIVCYEAIDLANSYGIKVFIIDHHEYAKLPNAASIIHSNLVDKKYGGLSAAGLAFLLSKTYYDDKLSLTLAGLSTISDVMPMIGFNRYLVKQMLNLLTTNTITKLNELNDYETFSYDNLSFNVIPKINALSRMEPLGNPNILVKYFIEDDITSVAYMEKINYINNERKLMSKNMMSEATSLLKGKKIEVLVSENFKEGLCGVVASRLNHSLNKPVIVLSKSEGMLKGSGRSIDSFNIYENLKSFNNYDTYGGHEGAIGFSLKEEYLDDFVKFVDTFDIIEESKDALLLDLEDINFDLVNYIDELSPFGTNFKKPLLAIKNENFKKIIVSNKYPKFLISNDLSAISFDENLKDVSPKYLIGSIKADNYKKGAVSFIIEDLI